MFCHRHDSFYSATHRAVAMVDLKKLALAFLPVATEQPPILRDQPAFAIKQHGIQVEFIAASICEWGWKQKCTEPCEQP